MRMRVGSFVWATGVVLMFAGNLSAGTVSTFFNNVRYFPASGGTVSDTVTRTLTASTVDSHATSFSSNPGNNTFDGLDTITGSPVLMGVRNSVTINQATDSSFSGWLSFAVMAINESGVTVTGASGTGFLLPTFHFRGTFDVGNPALYSFLDTCDGNSSCTVASPASDIGGSQPQNVDLFYTPAIDSTTSFQFGTPFSIHYGLTLLSASSVPQRRTPAGRSLPISPCN